MAYTPLYITDFQEGLVKNKEQFLLPDNAFSNIENAYVWRGVITKKNGYYLLGHLERKLTEQVLGNGTAGAFSGNIITILSLEDSSSIPCGNGATADLIITVDSGGANEETFLEPVVSGVIVPDGTLVGNNGGTGTINYLTGAITLTSDSTWTTEEITITFRYRPNLPIMGMINPELEEVNNEELVVFDTKYAYKYSSSSKRFSELLGAGTTWTGTSTDFFSYINYSSNVNGKLTFVTNFNINDPIRYYDTTTWTDYKPLVSSTQYLHQARWLLPFKGRMLAFNTYEGTTSETATNYSNRLRYSWVGTPTDATAWRSDIVGKGGYIDATTNEIIVSVNRIKDTVIVGFERSMYVLRYTGNEILPFVWEKVNSRLGIDSPFSTIEFDKGVIGFGQSDIITSNGYDVQLADTNIPDFIESVENDNNGHLKVHGYYDKYKKLCYFTYARAVRGNLYPDRILCFNPENDSYSILKDRFSVFGTWQPFDDAIWGDLDYFTWAEWQTPWGQSSLASLMPHVVAGNHQGAVVVYNDINTNLNAPVQIITAVGTSSITAPEHGLDNGDFIYIDNIIGKGEELNGNIYKISIEGEELTLFELSGNVFSEVVIADGTYLGCGTYSIVNNLNIKSKRFNFLSSGISTKLGYIDLLCRKTINGQFNVHIYSGNDSSTPINSDLTDRSNTVNTYVGLDENSSIDKVMRRLYINAVAQNVQFSIFIDDENMMDKSLVSSDLDISAITVWATGAGRVVT